MIDLVTTGTLPSEVAHSTQLLQHPQGGKHSWIDLARYTVFCHSVYELH